MQLARNYYDISRRNRYHLVYGAASLDSEQCRTESLSERSDGAAGRHREPAHAALREIGRI